ncbi:MAG: ATP-binding protein [Acidobacteriota bacterium]|nr:ATP-binding protein [Acidobacteriota bacterium]
MIIRSLRWRLVIAMGLIIAAVAGTSGLFSSVTVKRELDRFLVAQRLDETRSALRLFRSGDVDDAMRRAHEQFGFRSLIVEEGKVVRFYPPEMGEYRVHLLPNDGLELTRNGPLGREALRIQGMSVVLRGVGRVHLLPSHEEKRGAPRAMRVSVDRWLVAGLSTAALLAVMVMLTIFRRVFRPVEALTEGARALAGGRLDARVDVRGNDEVAELGRAFNSMAEALERNERARRSMVSDVAHELRTPLTSIRVQIEAVQDGVIEPDAKWIASIAEDAAALAHLVDDLQQLSLADAGALKLDLAEVAIAEVIERALNGLGADGIAIAVRVTADLHLRADARRLVQVVRNLVVNALAFATSTIEITATAMENRGVEIRVADDGPGVPAEHADRIFDRFYRADPSRSRATGGAGLGLAIARQLVELHGGTIRYERPAFIVRL